MKKASPGLAKATWPLTESTRPEQGLMAQEASINPPDRHRRCHLVRLKMGKSGNLN
jgi:hypothetical protein